MSISYEKTFQGAWKLTTLDNGYLQTRQYMGYTKAQATALFVEEFGN
jgi:hypothetical protein